MNDKIKKKLTTRRTVLKAIGVGGIVGRISSNPVEAATINSYSGTREREFTPDSSGDFWTQESWFTSSELENDYGTNTFNVSPDSPLPRNAIPPEYRDPDGSFKVSYSESVKIAEFQEWEDEQNNTGYTGPKYAFKTNVDNPGPSDLGKPEAPINLGWTWGTATEIEDTMENEGWNSRWTTDWREGINDPRWIVIRNSSGNIEVRKTKAHIAKEIRDQSIPIANDTWSLDQWHIRTWNIDGDDDEVDVVGQVHHDPWDHGKLTIKDVGIENLWTFSTQKPNWAFSTARQLVSDDWQSWGSAVSTIDLGNQDGFPTSDGKMDKIYQP